MIRRISSELRDNSTDVDFAAPPNTIMFLRRCIIVWKGKKLHMQRDRTNNNEDI